MQALLQPDRRPVIAHRGASGHAPENTLEAFRLAIDMGADALELDVHVTRDGVPMVHHDPTLDRTCGRPGRIGDLTAAALRDVDAGTTWGDGAFAGRGIRIPRFAEVLEACPTVPLLVEIKVDQAQEAVRDALRRAKATQRAVVASFRWQALRTFDPGEFLVGASRRDIVRLVARSLLALPTGAPRCRLYAVPDRWRGFDVPSHRVVRRARRSGCPVHVWTVNDPSIAARLWQRGVAGIITNYPDRMLTLRRDLGLEI